MVTASASGVDRRVQRTRQLIDQATREVVREKGFKATRVRDIVDRANISRGTFYAHYADKYALADALIRAEFRRTVTDELPPATQWDRRTVRLLVQMLLEQAGSSRPACRDAALLRPLIQRAAHEELSGLVSAWLAAAAAAPVRSRVPVAADLVSWTIMGALCRWREGPPALTAEARAEQVLSVIMEGVGGQFPSSVW
jgi:AcrR family transcriptional regulator